MIFSSYCWICLCLPASCTLVPLVLRWYPLEWASMLMSPQRFISRLSSLSLSLYLSPSLYISIYLYICAVESKLGPTIAFFESKLGPIFLSFLCLCFSKIFFFLQGEWDVHKNRTKIRQTLPFLSQNLVQSCFATYLDQVLTQPWTKFWLNLFGNLGPFFLLQKMLKPLSL